MSHFRPCGLCCNVDDVNIDDDNIDDDNDGDYKCQ